MINLDNKIKVNLKRGDKVKYTKHFMFGKTGTEITKVIMINKFSVLLENGDTINLITK